jgi:hypothetical protein
MTSTDRILIIFVVSALLVMFARLWTDDTDASYLQIQTSNNAPVTEELFPDRTLHIKGSLGESVIEINNGRARFISSPCRGQVCVHSGWLHTSGDIAACLPNRVSLTMLGQHPRFDTINY